MLTFNLECFNEAPYISAEKEKKNLPYEQVAKICSSKIALRKNKAITIDSILKLNCHPREKLIKIFELSNLKFETAAGVNPEGFGWSIFLPLFTFLPKDKIAISQSGGISVDNIGFQHNFTMQKFIFELPVYNFSQVVLLKFITALLLYQLEFDTKISGFNSRYGTNLANGLTFEICGPANTTVNYSLLVSLLTISGPISNITDQKSIYLRLFKNIFSLSNPRITNLCFEHTFGIGNEYIRYQIGTTSFLIKLLSNKERTEQRYFHQSLQFNLKTIYQFLINQISNNK